MKTKIERIFQTILFFFESYNRDGIERQLHSNYNILKTVSNRSEQPLILTHLYKISVSSNGSVNERIVDSLWHLFCQLSDAEHIVYIIYGAFVGFQVKIKWDI